MVRCDVTRHPYFDCPVPFLTDLPTALDAARQQARPVRVVYGGERCAATRSLLEKTMCKDEVAEMASEQFVALAADNRPTSEPIEALLRTLPKREPTPVCIYLAPTGEVLLSTVGGRPPAVMMNDMMQARAKLRSEPRR